MPTEAPGGKDLDRFWSAIVVGVHGFYADYLAGTVAGSTHELSSCYTGFGNGTAPGWWWFPTHEHGHLVHSMVMCSNAGHFGFPDAPWTLPGKFSEDFSFLAYNWRQMPARGGSSPPAPTSGPTLPIPFPGRTSSTARTSSTTWSAWRPGEPIGGRIRGSRDLPLATDRQLSTVDC